MAYEIIRNHGHISSMLKRAKESNSLLNVNIVGHKGDFTSAILDMDSDRSLMILDELNPNAGHSAIKKNTEIGIMTRFQGIEAVFQLVVKSIGVQDNIHYYVTPFPREIRYLQRREAHRVPVALTLDGTISIVTEKHAAYGRLQDLSFGGMGGMITSGGNKLAPGKAYTCTLDFALDSPITTEIEIRFLGNASSQGLQRFGAKFVNIKQADRIRIERLVAEIQRELIRKGTTT